MTTDRWSLTVVSFILKIYGITEFSKLQAKIKIFRMAEIMDDHAICWQKLRTKNGICGNIYRKHQFKKKQQISWKVTISIVKKRLIYVMISNKVYCLTKEMNKKLQFPKDSKQGRQLTTHDKRKKPAISLFAIEKTNLRPHHHCYF